MQATARTSCSATRMGTLSDSDIRSISDFVYRQTGIVLGARKRYLIENRLHSVVRMAGLGTLRNLCRALAQNSKQIETLVIDALTTNETSWFRGRKPFTALEKQILPILARSNKNRMLRIWSAASSSGQEAYSLAMLIKESRLFDGWQVEIVGTDVSSQILEKARAGVYSQMEISRGLPVQLLVKYFEQVGNEWRLCPEVREMVAFRRQRLQEESRSRGVFDLVFCRNALIYFDMETRRRILQNIHRALAPSGLLALGGSESTLNLSDEFTACRCGGTVYYAKTDSQFNWRERLQA